MMHSRVCRRVDCCLSVSVHGSKPCLNEGTQHIGMHAWHGDRSCGQLFVVATYSNCLQCCSRDSVFLWTDSAIVLPTLSACVYAKLSLQL
jgi:hypothetical protein